MKEEKFLEPPPGEQEDEWYSLNVFEAVVRSMRELCVWSTAVRRSVIVYGLFTAVECVGLTIQNLR